MKDPDTVKITVVPSESVEFESDVTAGAGKMLPFPREKAHAEVSLPPRWAEMARDGRIDLITIEGPSLEGIGIYDGDQVLCRTVKSVKEIKRESICIVRVVSTGEVLAKKVQMDYDMVALRSFNPSVKTRHVEPEEIEVQGIILQVLRGPDERGRFDRGYLSPEDEIPF